MSCSCRLITSRSVTLARASTRMRRLLMQQQAVRMLHQTEARVRNQLSHSHMFAEWTVHLHRFAERVLFQQPAVYVAGHALQTNLREQNFPDRKVRRRVPPTDLDNHQRAIRALLQRPTDQQRVKPVSFRLTNEWNDTITSDKKHHLEHFTRGMT